DQVVPALQHDMVKLAGLTLEHHHLPAHRAYRQIDVRLSQQFSAPCAVGDNDMIGDKTFTAGTDNGFDVLEAVFNVGDFGVSAQYNAAVFEVSLHRFYKARIA